MVHFLRFSWARLCPGSILPDGATSAQAGSFRPISAVVEMRRLTETDALAVSDLIHAVVFATPHLKDHPNTPLWLRDWYSPEQLEVKIKVSYGLTLVVDGQLQAVGFVDPASGYISGIYVLRRGLGYGSRLLQELLAQLAPKK